MIKEQLQGITLYNGDNMELLKSLPDNAFDLAIVDPPYGIPQSIDNQLVNKGGQWNRFGGRFDRYKKVESVSRGNVGEEVRQKGDYP